MKLSVNSLALGAALLLSTYASAQAPVAAPAAKPAASAPAPAAAKGVTVANPLASATTAAAPTGTATTPAKKEKAAGNTPATAAAGGAVGKVWVNTASKVYHCFGTTYYGKTKAGEYMSEADAKAKGNHANNKKTCS